MIHKFTAKNFYSFKDTFHVSFVVNDNTPQKACYVPDIHQRINTVIANVGPNAAGKTNMLKVLSFFHYLFVHSFEHKPNEDIPFEPYLFTTDKSIATELSVTFSCNNNLYEYFIVLTKKQILSEKLRKYNKSSKQFSTLFTRTWRDNKKEYVYSLMNYNVSSDFKTLVDKRKDASLISTAGQIEHKLSTEIIDYWSSFAGNVAQMGKQTDSSDIFEAAEFYYNYPEIAKKAEGLLTKFDLGLSKLRIDKHTHKSKEGKEETYYIPVVHHIGDKNKYPLFFYLESSGTQSLFSILSKILPVLEDGGIAILDEFDADLHPHMLSELIDLFLSKEKNPKNAQILFTTNHHEILNKLDKYQIIITEKNRENGTSEVWRLDEIKGVRVDDNYYAKYVIGAYGGIPEL
jgi:AAA15 family ATPase/GTPase